MPDIEKDRLLVFSHRLICHEAARDRDDRPERYNALLMAIEAIEQSSEGDALDTMRRHRAIWFRAA